jgi:Family of unknown function (DUF5565)
VQKIPTLFIRDLSRQPALVTAEWHPACLWVRDGEGVATRKYDGTCCMMRDGKLYKRRELRDGDTPPVNFELVDQDVTTCKSYGWVPVGDGPEDKWHRTAYDLSRDPHLHGAPLPDGTYELVGPKIQGGKDNFATCTLLAHATAAQYPDAPRYYEGLRAWFNTVQGECKEGLVWHHPDGRMAKIKRRDFGLKW